MKICALQHFFLTASLANLYAVTLAESRKTQFVLTSSSTGHDPKTALKCGRKCKRLDTCMQFNISPNGICIIGVKENTGNNYEKVVLISNTASQDTTTWKYDLTSLTQASTIRISTSTATGRETTAGSQESTTGGLETDTASLEITTVKLDTTIGGQGTTTNGLETTTRVLETTTRVLETTTRGIDTTTRGLETTAGGLETTSGGHETSSSHDNGVVYCDISAASMPFVAPEDAFIASGLAINGVEWNCLTTGCVRSVEDDYIDFNPPSTNGFDDYFRTFYGTGHMVTFEGANVNYYKWSDYYNRYNEVDTFPRAVNAVFPSVPTPIDAADAYMTIYEDTGNVYIIQNDMVYEYDFTGNWDLSATLLQSFSITSNSDHPFNKIPQSPPQMPSGITALHISKHLGKSFAFVGSHFYTHEWGTGTWTYEGLVICPVDP